MDSPTGARPSRHRACEYHHSAATQTAQAYRGCERRREPRSRRGHHCRGRPPEASLSRPRPAWACTRHPASWPTDVFPAPSRTPPASGRSRARHRSLAALECKNFHDAIAVEVGILDWTNRREAQVQRRSRHPAGRGIEGHWACAVDHGHKWPLRLEDVIDAMGQGSGSGPRVSGRSPVPERLSRPARTARPYDGRKRFSPLTRLSRRCARLGHESMGSSRTANSAIRSAVPSRSTSAIAGTPMTRPDEASIGRRRLRRIAQIGRKRPQQRAILAGNRQKRRRAVNGPDEIARAVAIEVGRRLHQHAWPLSVAETAQPAQRGDRVARGGQGPRAARHPRPACRLIHHGESASRRSTRQNPPCPLSTSELRRPAKTGCPPPPSKRFHQA